MYGGTGYSFAKDPDFMDVSTSSKFWDKKIDAFYSKYTGFRDWHTKIVKEAVEKGQLVLPTGRIFKYELKKGWNGELEAPETIIKNYPVQSLGADIMSIARVSFHNRFKASKINGLEVNTIHDSIVVDVEEKDIQATANMMYEVFEDLAANFEKMFKVPFNLPLRCEIGVGKNMKELVDIPYLA